MITPPRKRFEHGPLKKVWQAFNELRDYSIAIRPLSGIGATASQTGNGTRINAQAPPGTVIGRVRMFRVKSQEDDYLVCREFDGTTEDTEDVNIAKPYDLRVAGWNGQSIVYDLEDVLGGGTLAVTYTKITASQRSAVSSTATEYQAIRPFYIDDKSIIFAAKADNGTGVDGCDWIDLNADGRAFAKIA